MSDKSVSLPSSKPTEPKKAAQSKSSKQDDVGSSARTSSKSVTSAPKPKLSSAVAGPSKNRTKKHDRSRSPPIRRRQSPSPTSVRHRSPSPKGKGRSTSPDVERRLDRHRSKSKHVSSPFGRRVATGADETLSKRRRRQPVHLSLPSSPTASDYDERIGIFNFEVMRAPRAQPQAQAQEEADLFPAPPRRRSAETPPYVENLALDPRFAALLGSPNKQEEGATLNTGGGNDPTSADTEEAAATSDVPSVEQEHEIERAMEVSGEDIFPTPATSPGAAGAAAAQAGGESATSEATPSLAAQANLTPPPAQVDAAEAEFEAEREQLRTPPPLVIDAALQELAAAAHDISDSEQEEEADEAAEPLEAQAQASPEEAAPEVTHPAGDASPKQAAQEVTHLAGDASPKPLEAQAQASPEQAAQEVTHPAGNAS